MNHDITILKTTSIKVYDRQGKEFVGTLSVTNEPFNRMYLVVNGYQTVCAPDGITLANRLYNLTGLIIKDNIELTDRGSSVVITTTSEKTGGFNLSPRMRSGRLAPIQIKVETEHKPRPKKTKKTSAVVKKTHNPNFPKWGSYSR